MNSHMLIGLLAETPLHPGTGQSNDVIDLPVSRERITGHPTIHDSSTKGALKQWAVEIADLDADSINILFGKDSTTASSNDSEGGYLNVSAAKLLFLPIRRLEGAYAWTTAPYLVETLGRFLSRSKLSETAYIEPTLPDEQLRVFANWGAQKTHLEEYVFTLPNPVASPNWLQALKGKLVPDELYERLVAQAAVMSDNDFRWFAENALPVQARNVLDKHKLSQNLWYEETIPQDTIFFIHLGLRAETEAAKDAFKALKEKIKEKKYLVVGGDESLGRGWAHMTVFEGPA